MKSPQIRDADSRFSGRLRHYHRTNTQPNRTWDEWVDGKSSDVRKQVPWMRGILAVIAIAALLAVITGLVIELR